MKRTRTVCFLVVLSVAFEMLAHGQQSSLTIASAVERQLNGIEKNIVEAAEAMPESKFNFTPESLSIRGSDYRGVRTFAGQVKHLATDNYAI